VGGNVRATADSGRNTEFPAFAPAVIGWFWTSVAIAGTTLLVACGGSSSGGATSRATPSAAQLDTNGVCAFEAAFETGVLASGDAGTASLITAIGGVQSAQFKLALAITGPFNQMIQQAGVAAAFTSLGMLARQQCSSINNPLLTKGQVASLEQIVPADDAAVLANIVQFADAPARASGCPSIEPNC